MEWWAATASGGSFYGCEELLWGAVVAGVARVNDLAIRASAVWSVGRKDARGASGEGGACEATPG